DNLALLHLKTHVSESPKLLNFIALNDLSTAEKIVRLSYEIARLLSDQVAQRSVPLMLRGLVTNQVAFRQVFDGDGDIRHYLYCALTSGRQSFFPSFETGGYPAKDRIARRLCLTGSRADKADFARPVCTSEIRR